MIKNKIINGSNYNIEDIRVIDIFSPECIINIIKSLSNVFVKKGIKVNHYKRIILKKDIDICLRDKSRYLFICCPHCYYDTCDLTKLPKNKYFIYQVEKLDILPHKYLSEYTINLIKNSKETFEFSNVNMEFYPDNCKGKVSLLIPSIAEFDNNEETFEKKIDVLFAGRKTEHRENICQALRLIGYNVVYITNVYENELTTLIKKSRIFLNLHLDDSKCLETFRLNEAIMCPNVHIISEKSGEPDIEKLYGDRVHFIEKIIKNECLELVLKIKELLYSTEIKQFNINNWNNITTLILNKRFSNIHLYPKLFHKYLLRLRNSNDNLIQTNYKIIKECTVLKNICHIHCFHLHSLSTMFDEYIVTIQKMFDIIVTYTHTDIDTLTAYDNITFLQVKNYGMDIGPKFTIYHYLNTKMIDYNYIFYIHSKSDNDQRKSYITPFINNLNKINIDNTDLHCYFNDLLHYGCGYNSYTWFKNEDYMNDIINYLNIKNNKHEKLFVEGNFYILHKKIIHILFSDKMLYNILNTNNSFDYQWVSIYYGLKDYDIYECYNKYKENNYYGNNLATDKGHDGLADSMIEHIFERLPIILCKEYKINIHKLSNHNHEVIFNGNNQIISQTSIINKDTIKTETKTLCIVACHTNSNIKIKSLYNNVKYFQEIADNIIYINSSEFKSLNVMNDMIYIENDNTACYGKYLHILSVIDTNIYDNVILTNDSFLITKSLVPFKNIFNSWIEMSALIGSQEETFHYPDFIRRYNSIGIRKIKEFYEKELNTNYTFSELINNIEIKSHNIHKHNINVLYPTILNYFGNIHFDNIKMEEYLNNYVYPIIKIKKLQITDCNYENRIPPDFDPTIYRTLHADLISFDDESARTHFINHGMSEGRIYKNNQSSIYPDFLTKYLHEINFIL